MTFDRGILKLKRNHRTENEMALSQQSRRNLMYRYVSVWAIIDGSERAIQKMCVSIQFDRVTVYSLDEQRQVKFVHSTSIQSTTLSKNEEVRISAVSGE